MQDKVASRDGSALTAELGVCIRSERNNSEYFL